MVLRLVLLTTAVVAILGQTDVSTCGPLFSADGECQNDSAALLQAASVPFPFQASVKTGKTRAKTSKNDSNGLFGPVGPKHQQPIAYLKHV